MRMQQPLHLFPVPFVPFRLQADNLFLKLRVFLARRLQVFFLVFELDLGIDQLMLEIVEFLVLLGKLLLHHLDLLLRLEIIIGDVQLQKNALVLLGLVIVAVQLLKLRDLIVNICSTFCRYSSLSYPLKVKILPAIRTSVLFLDDISPFSSFLGLILSYYYKQIP